MGLLRNWKIVALVFFCLSIAVFCFAEGRVFLESSSVDLGTLAEGKLYKYSLPVKNIGDSNLSIRVVQSTCGCVEVLEPKQEVNIASRGKAEIKYSIDTTGFNGEVIKYLYIHTSDKANPITKVFIKANVERKKEALLARFKLWKVSTVVGAGLIDGINPCAFTVLVFFMSFLAFVGYKKKQMLILGSFFILAVFITYLMIGFGLFEFFRQLEIFSSLAKVIYYFTAILALVLGVMSFYDYLVYKKTKDPESVTLKLPEIIKQRIHSAIRQKTDRRVDPSLAKGSWLRLAFAALSCGFIVSILESVCTGQMYLPTIIYILGVEQLRFKALLFLVLYNLMFILPLVIIFIMALWGMTSETFARIAKNHLAKIKIATSAIFLGLGLGLLFILKK